MQPSKIPFKDRIIPWYFVIFFVLLAIVNVIFVTLAARSHPGTVQNNAYEIGLNYNEIIAASEQQDALGWKISIDYKSPHIILKLKDKNNMPLQGASIKAVAKSVLKKKQ
ncbi:MAG: FixH family protein, partial [Pseudomonadota bacterium]